MRRGSSRRVPSLCLVEIHMARALHSMCAMSIKGRVVAHCQPLVVSRPFDVKPTSFMSFTSSVQRVRRRSFDRAALSGEDAMHIEPMHICISPRNVAIKACPPPKAASLPANPVLH